VVSKQKKGKGRLSNQLGKGKKFLCDSAKGINPSCSKKRKKEKELPLISLERRKGGEKV